MPANSKSQARASRLSGIVRGVRSCLIVYVVLVVVLAFLQRKLIYYPTHADRLPASMLGSPADVVRDVGAITDDGIPLNGWHWSASTDAVEDANRFLVLFFHGNGGDRRHRVFDCQLLTRLGVDVLMTDYRGYGDNEGSPTEDGLGRDASAFWRLALSEGWSPDRIVLYGESLGGGVAVGLAAELGESGTPPAGMILRSTFASLTDAAAWHYPWLPVRWFLVDRFSSVARISGIASPLLMIHGDSDRIIPIEMGETLFEAAPETSAGIRRRFLRIPGGDHNNLVVTAAREIEEEIAEFLKQLRQD